MIIIFSFSKMIQKNIKIDGYLTTIYYYKHKMNARINNAETIINNSPLKNDLYDELFGENTLFNFEDNGADNDDYDDKKREIIDKYAMLWGSSIIIEIVNTYGVLEILSKISDNYGEDAVTDILSKNIDMKYRCIFYHILFDYITDIESDIREQCKD